MRGLEPLLQLDKDPVTRLPLPTALDPARVLDDVMVSVPAPPLLVHARRLDSVWQCGAVHTAFLWYCDTALVFIM